VSHKLSIDEVVTGLESEIWPERDVINKNGQGFAFTARWTAGAGPSIEAECMYKVGYSVFSNAFWG
jgi:hypothetical protein